MDNPVVVREIIAEDRVALWHWRNDPIVLNETKADRTLSYHHHRTWFKRLTRNKEVILCIGLVETLRIGCVRFDLLGASHYAASLFIKPLYCGKGYGTPMIAKSVEYLCSVRNVSKVTATTRNANSASRRLFEQAGFLVTQDGPLLRCEHSFDDMDKR